MHLCCADAPEYDGFDFDFEVVGRGVGLVDSRRGSGDRARLNLLEVVFS